MKYVVVWNRARFVVDGKRVVVTKGNEVPAGVDDAVLHDLVLVGAIVAASPPPATAATSLPPAAVAALVDPLDPGEVTRPAKNAKVEVWRAYAEHVGVDSSLTKAEIIEAVEAADAVSDGPRTGDPAVGEDGAGDPDSAGEDGDPADPDAPTIS